MAALLRQFGMLAGGRLPFADLPLTRSNFG
jgi:hypothetical protein